MVRMCSSSTLRKKMILDANVISALVGRPGSMKRLMNVTNETGYKMDVGFVRTKKRLQVQPSNRILYQPTTNLLNQKLEGLDRVIVRCPLNGSDFVLLAGFSQSRMLSLVV